MSCLLLLGGGGVVQGAAAALGACPAAHGGPAALPPHGEAQMEGRGGRGRGFGSGCGRERGTRGSPCVFDDQT
jgi:hypothetical protein